MSYRLSHRAYALPFKQPVRTAHGLWAQREGVILRLSDAEGFSAYGEAAPIPAFGTETHAEIQRALGALGETVTTESIRGLPLGLSCLRAGLFSAEAALAEHHKAATGQASEPETLNKYLPVAGLLPAGAACLRAADTMLEAGFRSFKWKVGVGDVADELGLLDDLLSRLPSGAKLRLDANGAWDRKRAEKWLTRCADRPIEFVEQPVAADLPKAEDLLLGLANDFPTPLALDESVSTCAQFRRWIDQGWPGLFVVKPSLLDHPEPLLTKVGGARVVFSSALETAVGCKRALKLAFRYSGEARALGFGVYPLFEQRTFDGPFLAPFIRREDVDRIDEEAVWNALS